MNHFLKLLFAGVVAAELALLAGCHHHDDSGSTTAPTSTDAFTSQVQGVVVGTDAKSETADPVAVSGITPTVSETAEPVPVTAN
jgi:uncharacterized lipoprotein YajG